jgi:hypothetical protein
MANALGMNERSYPANSNTKTRKGEITKKIADEEGLTLQHAVLRHAFYATIPFFRVFALSCFRDWYFFLATA